MEEAPFVASLSHPLTLPKQLVIFDLDGVVYRGITPTPGAQEAIASLVRRGIQVRYLTNNAALSRSAYVAKLSKMGISSVEDDFMTSAYATARYLLEQGCLGQQALVVGEEGLVTELNAAGIHAVMACDSDDEIAVDVVVVGIDRSFTYGRLKQAQQAIFHGAQFIATNQDATYPTEQGIFPGAGAVVAAVATAAGRQPFTVGKPNTYALDLILRSAGVPPERAVLVGDRLDTDIHVGRSAGLETILPLTGVTTLAHLYDLDPESRPSTVIPDLRSLDQVLSEATAERE